MTPIKFKDRKVAELSTAHILAGDRDLLLDCKWPCVMGNEFGVIVVLLSAAQFPDRDAELEEKGFSPVFINLLHTIRDRGFGYVWFYADGEVTPGLKTFE